MVKLALIGDARIRHYAVADRLWELLSVVTHTKLTYTTKALTNPQEVIKFFEAFRRDRTFRGFSIGIPWKRVLFDRVDRVEELVRVPYLNMVYKATDGAVVGVNTDPLAAQKAIEANHNLYKCASALVIGTAGSGLPIASHLADNLNKATYLYDQPADDVALPDRTQIKRLGSLNDMAERRYDLIVNTTPFGRFHTDEQIDTFASPLDLQTLEQVTHPDTIVQETNYLPGNTLLLQMAERLGLKVVTGDLMLVYRAVENFRRYFEVVPDESTIQMLIGEIGVYIAEREAMVLDGATESLPS